MRVWSHRPQSLHLAPFFAAYVLGCGFAHALAIVPGITVSIWPPAGIFIATLILTSPYSWPWWVLAGCLAEMFAQFVWFHSPLLAGFLIYVGNALSAVLGAALVNWVCGRRARLETLREVLAFVVLGAGVAPLTSATVGSATLAWFGVKSQTFASVWPLFWIGDATGILLVAPLALLAIQHWRRDTRLSAAQWTEAGLLGLIFLGIAALSLSDGYLPSPYIIMPALLWVAVRFEFRGAAVALTLLALITVTLTITGDSQFLGDAASQRERQVMLQLFLAISALSALIVAAISRQHQQAMVALRESVGSLQERERELSQLVDLVPSHVWRLTPDGEPTFFNRRMVEALGIDVPDTDRPGMTRLAAMIEAAVHPGDATAFGEALRHCLATGERFAMRYRLRRRDGTYRWMSSRAEALRDQNGRIVQWYGLCHDIDEQVKAEETLRQSERQLQEMIDAVPVRIWAAAPNGGSMYFNKRYQDHFGAVLPDFDAQADPRIDTLLQELIHPEDLASVQRQLGRSFETGSGCVMRFRWREKDATYRWAECRVEARRDAQGAIAQWYGVSLDIDDEVRAQEVLRERERELSQLVDMIPIHVWRLTPEGEPTFYNKRLIDFLGLDVVDVSKPGMSRLAATIATFIHPEDADAVEEALRHAIAFGERVSIRYRMRRADGVYRWLECRAEPLRDAADNILQWYGANVDIDDAVTAQQALADRERELSQLVDMVPVHIRRLTPEGEPTFFNKRLLDFFGLHGVGELDKPGMSRLAAAIGSLVHPEDSPKLMEAVQRALASGEPFAMKYRMRDANGAYRWVDGRGEPLRDQTGAIVQWYAISVDIDDQMRLFTAIEDREARIRRLIDSDVIGIVFWDLDGTLVDANDAFLRMVQYDREDLAAGLDWLAMTPPEWQEVHARDEAEELARTGKMQAREKEYFRKDGSRVPILIGAACFEGNSRQGIAYILDLTERKHAEAAQLHAEEALRQASDELAKAMRAASLAELSASIAHEVNQPLAAIVANSHACHRWLSADPPNLERAKITAERITRDANSAADVVTRIRAVFKQSTETRSSTALGSVIDEALDLMADEAERQHVRIDTDIEGDLPSVVLDRVQIQQVLVNLMRNGIEAMVSTTGARVLGLSVRRTGDGIQTTISDRGRGIEFPDRMFEPFFTTKEQGMGMGLAICRSIVESHGGRLWAESGEPHGARFVFTLPVEPKAAP